MSGRGVIKALSNMSIDEVSLVDRGANQHALISFAKRAPDAHEVFEKARNSSVSNGEFKSPKMQMKPTDEVTIENYNGDDPAGVVDEYVENDGKGDIGPGGKLGGKPKKSTEAIGGSSLASGSAPAGKGGPKGKGANLDTDSDEDVEEKNFKRGVKKSAAEEAMDFDDDDDDVSKALNALGMYLDYDDEVEKNFGPPSPFGQQQPQSPQFGNPPAMQSAAAMPMGMGTPQAPPGAGPAPAPMGGPAMPGGMPGQMQQPPMQMPQLPPEVIQYIQQLEQKLASSQGSSPEGSDTGSSDSSNSSSDSSSENKPFGKSEDYVDTNHFLEELSKALHDEDQVEAVAKALSSQQNAFQEELAKRDAQMAQLTEVAKSERDLRLEREFISKAAEFDLPVDPEDLGPVLKRAAESLTMDDFSVIVKCLDAAGASDALFGEIGKRGSADNADIFDMVEAGAEELAKSYDLTGEQALAQVFEMNPEIYDQYTANQRSTKF